jgi:two-component system, NarL family, response regulator LiaR
MKEKKIMIVENDKDFREILSVLIGFIDGAHVIDEAYNGIEFLDKIKNCDFDIVFMDIEMPLMNGIEATKEAVKRCNNLKIIGMSYHNDFKNINAILEAGAKNYVIKSEIDKEIIKKLIME